MTLILVWINENKKIMVDIQNNSFQISQIYLEDGVDGMISTYDVPDYEVQRVMTIVEKSVINNYNK